MNLSYFIAKRYLISKKKQNIINIISTISVGGIIVGTAALIIVLSVFNGFTGLMETFFSKLDPDLKITAVEGKMFNPNEYDTKKIKEIADVVHYAEVIEEVAMLKYGKQQFFGIVKGVPDNYAEYTHVDSTIIDGEFILSDRGINYAVVGQGVAYNLGIGLTFVDPIRIFVPRKGNNSLMNPTRSIKHNYIFPSGIFSVLEEVDSKYLIVPYQFAAELFESKELVSSIEIVLKDPSSAKIVKKEIEQILGEKFHVKTKYQQHDLVYKTMKSEKWAAYLILVFILIIASFNVIGSLSMLIIDKKEDILILRSMGASSQLIRKIFLIEGWLISMLGAVLGTLAGLTICWIQIKFGIVPLMGGESFIITAYPVKIIPGDIFMIFGIVLLIGFFAAWYPIKFISNKFLLAQNI